MIRTGCGLRALRPREHTRSLPRGSKTSAPAERAEHREERGEPDDDVEDRRRDVHADAEAEQQRPGDARSRPGRRRRRAAPAACRRRRA